MRGGGWVCSVVVSSICIIQSMAKDKTHRQSKQKRPEVGHDSFQGVAHHYFVFCNIGGEPTPFKSRQVGFLANIPTFFKTLWPI